MIAAAVSDGARFLGYIGIILLGVLLGMRLGPWLVKRVCKKAGLVVPPRRTIVGKCIGAGFYVAGCSLGVCMVGAYAVVFAENFYPRNEVIPIVAFVAVCLIAAVITVVWVGRHCGVPLEEVGSKAPPLPGKKPVYSAGVVVVILVTAAWFTLLPAFDSSRGRELAYRVMEMTNLNGIGKALQLYQGEHDQYPEHLGQLVDTEFASYKMFQVPMNNKAIQEIAKNGKPPYPAPPSLIYMPLPKDAPEGLLWVWPQPKAYEGKQIPVLYYGGKVEQITTEQLLEELGKLNRWQAEPKAKTSQQEKQEKKSADSEPLTS